MARYLLCCEGSCWRSRSHRRVWEPWKAALDGLGSWLLPPEAAAPSDRYHISGVRGPRCLPPDTKNKIGRHSGRILRTRGGRAAGATGAGQRDSPAFLPCHGSLATANRPHAAGLQININANENQYSALLMATTLYLLNYHRSHTPKTNSPNFGQNFARPCVLCARLMFVQGPFASPPILVRLGTHRHIIASRKPLRHFSRLCPHRLILSLSCRQSQFIFSC